MGGSDAFLPVRVTRAGSFFVREAYYRYRVLIQGEGEVCLHVSTLFF